jgi:hypothetical protein
LVTFPLTKTGEAFLRHRALAFFSEQASALIESLQPYQPSMEALGWLRDLSNADKHRLATISFTAVAEDPSVEAGTKAFSNLHVRFGTDEGHFGLMAVQAIAVTVEAAVQQIEALCADSPP